MVHTVILRTALKSFLSHDSRLVELELGISIDTNTNGLLHEDGLECLVRQAFLLLHPNILKNSLFLIILTLFLACLHPVRISLVVHKTMCCCISIRFVHPATIATIIGLVTVEELLHGEGGRRVELATDHTEGLHSGGCGEGPARSASSLVLRS